MSHLLYNNISKLSILCSFQRTDWVEYFYEIWCLYESDDIKNNHYKIFEALLPIECYIKLIEIL